MHRINCPWLRSGGTTPAPRCATRIASLVLSASQPHLFCWNTTCFIIITQIQPQQEISLSLSLHPGLRASDYRLDELQGPSRSIRPVIFFAKYITQRPTPLRLSLPSFLTSPPIDFTATPRLRAHTATPHALPMFPKDRSAMYQGFTNCVVPKYVR